jgi:hypothetical protein
VSGILKVRFPKFITGILLGEGAICGCICFSDITYNVFAPRHMRPSAEAFRASAAK